MVSVLRSGSSTPSSSPGPDFALCCSPRHFTLIVLDGCPVNLMLEVTSYDGLRTFYHVTLKIPGDYSSGLMCHLACSRLDLCLLT